MTFLVASDWHLSPRSPEAHGRLALAFLALARAGDATVVLNGDVFEELFFDAGRSRAAHPRVVSALDALARAGRLLRTCGNHDPGGGEERLLLDVPGLGRVLVEHGHRADPVHASPLGAAGDAISRRIGTLAPVRAAARLAEAAAFVLAGKRIAELFRRRCLAAVAREGCALGVFGHVHRPHCAPGDRYVNGGGLVGETLTWVALDRSGARLCRLRREDLPPSPDGIEPEMG